MHGGHGVVRAEPGVAWHAKKRTAGRAAVAAGLGATRGVASKQEVVLGAAAVKRGSGRQQVAWRGEEEPARGREAAG
jgi:hypothetical protein